MFTLACIAGYMLIVGGMLWGNHRWRLAQTPTPPPPDDPDDTADDLDDDVHWMPELPPVPFVAADGTLPAPWLPPVPTSVWSDGDEAAFRWFSLGAEL